MKKKNVYRLIKVGVRVELIGQRAFARFELVLVLQQLPARESRQRQSAYALLGKQIINKNIHVTQFHSGARMLDPELAVILQQGFQKRVHLHGRVKEPHIHSRQSRQVLEGRLGEVKLHNLGLWLQKHQLVEQAQKGRHAASAARETGVGVDIADVVHDPVKQRGGCEPKAVRFPVQGVLDPLAGDLFDQQRWVDVVVARSTRLWRALDQPAVNNVAAGHVCSKKFKKQTNGIDKKIGERSVGFLPCVPAYVLVWVLRRFGSELTVF